MTRTKVSHFRVTESTITEVHAAFATGTLTARRLVDHYLARIESFDKSGPRINSIITVHPSALDAADQLDAAYLASGPVGPLHGIPVIVKDQIDVRGTPTTLGSVLFEDYFPDRNSFVADKLIAAGAIILGKATLGELGRGDTHGTLFGSTRNPYGLKLTVGGSSGGSAAAVAANLSMVALGQEGYASIRRPSAWNSVVGMRPTAGLVSRSGVYGGWPSRAGSVGPITRTVEDAAKVLDAITGYDREDPTTASGVGQAPQSYLALLDADGLQGARVGVIRQPIGHASEPSSRDFKQVTEVFDRAVTELRAAGAKVSDDVEIPELDELLALRARDGDYNEQLMHWLGRSTNPPYTSLDQLKEQPGYAEYLALRGESDGGGVFRRGPGAHYAYLVARDELMTKVLAVMADRDLDVLVHKSVEHTPTLLRDGINPPFTNHKGAPQLNTFLIHVPAITVPAGFTQNKMPVGITFMGRPYSDGAMLRYAYAYEAATNHRRPPATTPEINV